MRSVILVVLLSLFIPSLAIAQDSSGTDFWVAFPPNVPPDGTMTLSISANLATTGSVTNASLAINIPFAVAPGTPTIVTLPNTVVVDANDTILDRGVHVTALAPVIVFATNARDGGFSSGTYLALPTDFVGTDYINLAWGTGSSFGTHFTIVATEDDTDVTITPSVNAGARVAGVPYVINLDQGQTYMLFTATDDDLTGSTISADRPIGVFGGHSCAEVPDPPTGNCDYIIEQLFPTNTWGTNIPLMPLASRTGGDIVRVLAGQNGTNVSINGVFVAALNAGQFYQASIAAPAHITSNLPVSVAQYAKGTEADGVDADPLEMTVLPTSRYLPTVIFATSQAQVPANFVTIIAPTPAIATVEIDGVPIPPASFTPIASSGYSGARVPVTLGEHRATAATPIGVSVYGFDDSEGVGFPGAAFVYALDVDLSISKTAGAPAVPANGPVTYTITVTNSGPGGVFGALVEDDFPAALTNVQWTCTATPGSSCAAAGIGDISDYINLPVGGVVTYNVTATAPPVEGPLSNTATVTVPDNTNDPVSGNNSSTADITITAPVFIPAVPTMSEWALLLLALMLGIVALSALPLR